MDDPRDIVRDFREIAPDYAPNPDTLFNTRVRPDLFPEAAINPREYMSNYFGIEL